MRQPLRTERDETPQGLFPDALQGPCQQRLTGGPQRRHEEEDAVDRAAPQPRGSTRCSQRWAAAYPQRCQPTANLVAYPVPGRSRPGPGPAMPWCVAGQASYLVDPASSHMLVSKIKPCMSKYKQCTVKLRMAH
jgi:hypothetical protein